MWDWLTGLPWTGIGTAVAAVTGTGAFAVAALERRTRLKDQRASFDIKRIGHTRAYAAFAGLVDRCYGAPG